MVHIGNDWDALLAEEFNKDYYLSLREFLKAEYFSHKIYPPMNDIFNALRYTSYENARVVILGQDPYHGPGQAHGLCFSVKRGIPLPPSLKNIFKEYSSDLNREIPVSGSLENWARSGILLLNSVLSVDAHCPGSHRAYNWEKFTDAVIREISRQTSGKTFILWGSYALRKAALIDETRHKVITGVHPSPLSAYRGFFNSRPFSRALPDWPEL